MAVTSEVSERVPVALRKESVDRNMFESNAPIATVKSLSARRAWIEILVKQLNRWVQWVALRKESVDRNNEKALLRTDSKTVALRKESVDRNMTIESSKEAGSAVALRKESVDRNV